MNQYFWQFELEKAVTESSLIRSVGTLLGIPPESLFTEKELWNQVLQDPSREMLGYDLSVGQDDLQAFRTRLNLVNNTKNTYRESDRLRLARDLAIRFDSRVLTGDYSMHSEYLLVDPEETVYFADVESLSDEWLRLKAIRGGRALEDFIAEMAEYE